LSPKEDKEFFSEIDINCTLDKPYYYRSEEAVVICRAKNIGNTNFKTIKFCIETDCKDKKLPIGAETNISWILDIKRLKYPEIIVTAESINLVRYRYLTLKIIETPKVDIIDFGPKTTDYNLKSNFSLLLNSSVTAYNLTLYINGNLITKMETFEGERMLLVAFEPKYFRRGRVNILLQYQDEIGKVYTTENTFTMELTNVPWQIRFIGWIENMLGIEIRYY